MAFDLEIWSLAEGLGKFAEASGNCRRLRYCPEASVRPKIEKIDRRTSDEASAEVTEESSAEDEGS